jgi:hypothetical protein
MFHPRNLPQRRLKLSKEEATQIAEAILPIYLADLSPGLQRWFAVEYATIIHSWTREWKNCWELCWNNTIFAQSNDVKDSWVGPGPIIVNKWTAAFASTLP